MLKNDSLKEKYFHAEIFLLKGLNLPTDSCIHCPHEIEKAIT